MNTARRAFVLRKRLQRKYVAKLKRQNKPVNLQAVHYIDFKDGGSVANLINSRHLRGIR